MLKLHSLSTKEVPSVTNPRTASNSREPVGLANGDIKQIMSKFPIH